MDSSSEEEDIITIDLSQLARGQTISTTRQSGLYSKTNSSPFHGVLEMFEEFPRGLSGFATVIVQPADFTLQSKRSSFV